MRGAWAVAVLMTSVVLAGCASVGDEPMNTVSEPVDNVPYLGYVPDEPDASMVLDMFDIFPAGSTGNILHGRVVMPAGDGPFPTIVQHTPYTAPGCNTFSDIAAPIEPPVGGCGEGTFEREFAKRGYVYIHADLRGTGDSNDCLNLRGQADIDDIGALADAIAAQPWSNGNVGFIGASYPGSTSHMAAMSGSPAVKAVVPIVASTSFYHYHHNDGVPYSGQHSLGGTNTGYTRQGVTPTMNPASGLAKIIGQPLCPHVENAVIHGGLDQSGDYYAWWQERNLRPGAKDITVPVLMAQGLADWNVKPDHIEHWFNDLGSESKTFIGGQWGHAYPASFDGACPQNYEARPGGNISDCEVPWGDWWAYASAFFDTYLKEIDTGMFNGSTAWVQANDGTWHRSSTFPLLDDEASSIEMALHGDGTIAAAGTGPEHLSWHACPREKYGMGTAANSVESQFVQCEHTQLVFETDVFANDTLISGTPELRLTVDSNGKMVHIVAVMDILDENGNVVQSRENYGYLNTRFHAGFPADEAIPTGPYTAVVDMYPQEDLVKTGHALRITIKSHDDGRTIESFEETDVHLLLDGQSTLWLPLRPAEMQGLRLEPPVES